jgi:hypothetical protein
MSDFLSHNDEIDFDRAASAFPDISLDGAGDIPASSAPNPGAYAWDDFDTRPAQEVKVTGDDEIEKFEDQFPDIGSPQVSEFSYLSSWSAQVLPGHVYGSSACDLPACLQRSPKNIRSAPSTISLLRNTHPSSAA